jgi:hypothetical protein
MKVILIPVLAAAALLTASCAPTQRTAQDWALAAQRAETAEDHEALAKHYDELARTMQADADEERGLLAEYQRRPHRYGRRIQDLRSRSTALIRDFEASARDSRQMADFHRQMAAELR